ncbi:MAG: hypothetical protein AAGF12_00965 [Myxococcota bacterium]
MRRTSFTFLVLFLACGDDSPEPSDAAVTPDATPDAVPDGMVPDPSVEDCIPIGAANELAPSDPNYAGMLRFYCDTWGGETRGGFPPVEFLLQLMVDEPQEFGNQFASFGFLPDPNDDLPIGLKRGIEDSTQVAQTCALCHVAELPDGRLWLGQPNGALDFGRFEVEVNARWVAAGNPPLRTANQLEKAAALGPGRTGAETADYPNVVPADFPAYYGLSDRTALNYLGTGTNIRVEVYLSVFSAIGRDEMKFPSPTRIDPFVAFMGGMQAPAGPAQDPAEVAMGEMVFQRERCGECHHVGSPGDDPIVTYDTADDPQERFPGDDPEFPAGSILTSRLHRILVDGDDSGMGSPNPDDRVALVNFIISQGLRVEISDGYRAADLRGIWATPPYLHNGSVPTLEDLLRPPAERPTSFERHGFTVDTTTPGNENRGHEFGTAISEDERAALAAYLRTL